MASITRNALKNGLGRAPRQMVASTRHISTTRQVLAGKPGAPGAPASDAEPVDPAVDPKKGGDGFLGVSDWLFPTNSTKLAASRSYPFAAHY